MKYKLIKEYPGSPILGTIVSPEMDDAYYINSNWITPENYPEFWELVVEKDYEILSFIGNIDNKIILNKDSQLKDCFCKIDGRSPFLQLEHLLQDDMFKIHSVKRLSDGEIFTLGDTIDCKSWFGNIIKFEIINDKLKIFQQQHVNSSRYKPLSIQDLIKIKTPLFTKEQRSEIEEIIKY